MKKQPILWRYKGKDITSGLDYSISRCGEGCGVGVTSPGQAIKKEYK